jgi:hypothetical protein
MTWDACTGRTVGFLEGMSREEFIDFKFHIGSCSRFLGQPLMLPEILLHMITFQLNEHSRIPSENDFYPQEQRTGLSNLPYFSTVSHSAVWQWNLQDFQQATTIANRSLTTMAFLKRRFRFITQYAQKMLSLLAELKESNYQNDHIATIIKKEDEWRQRLSDRISQSETYEHQTECMQIRIENLNTVVCIEKVTSRINC